MMRGGGGGGGGILRSCCVSPCPSPEQISLLLLPSRGEREKKEKRRFWVARIYQVGKGKAEI